MDSSSEAELVQGDDAGVVEPRRGAAPRAPPAAPPSHARSGTTLTATWRSSFRSGRARPRRSRRRRASLQAVALQHDARRVPLGRTEPGGSASEVVVLSGVLIWLVVRPASGSTCPARPGRTTGPAVHTPHWRRGVILSFFDEPDQPARLDLGAAPPPAGPSTDRQTLIVRRGIAIGAGMEVLILVLLSSPSEGASTPARSAPSRTTCVTSAPRPGVRPGEQGALRAPREPRQVERRGHPEPAQHLPKPSRVSSWTAPRDFDAPGRARPGPSAT